MDPYELGSGAIIHLFVFGNQRRSLHRQNDANKGATRCVDAPVEGGLDRIDALDRQPT